MSGDNVKKLCIAINHLNNALEVFARSSAGPSVRAEIDRLRTAADELTAEVLTECHTNEARYGRRANIDGRDAGRSVEQLRTELRFYDCEKLRDRFAVRISELKKELSRRGGA